MNVLCISSSLLVYIQIEQSQWFFRSLTWFFAISTEAHYHGSSKKLRLLHDFLAQRGSPEEAQAAAGNLKADAGKKWGSAKVGERRSKYKI